MFQTLFWACPLLENFYSDIHTILSVFFSVDVTEKKDAEIETAKKEEEKSEKAEGTIKLTLTHMHASL